MVGINIKNLIVEYDVAGFKLRVIDGLNLDLDTRKITVILGKSGCGKTTLLRMIKGLEDATSGDIDRCGAKIGVVFQEPRLFDWLTIYKNIIFAMSTTNTPVDEAKIDRLLQMVGLERFKNSYPRQLSGGMQSRASLIRTLAYDNDYILMDEPFAALDYFTRKALQKQLIDLYNNGKFGILLVTHSIDEALILADDILVMEGGKIKARYSIGNRKRDLLDDEFIELKRNIIKDLE